MIASLPAAPAATTTIPAEADAFVVSSNPEVNRGDSTSLGIRNQISTSLRIRNNIKISYVRFNVPSLPTSVEVSAATLRVYATKGSNCPLGVEVLGAANETWGETTITWNNQPGATGAVIASSSWTAAGYIDFDVTSAVTGAGPVSFVLRQAAGCDLTSDALNSRSDVLRSRQASTNQPQLVLETDAPPPAPACSDGLDSDADGLIDFPADPGCVDGADTDETDAPPPAPACSDGLDSDADGLIDFPADPGCVDGADTDETDAPPPAPACSDGLDSDADGLIDFPADPGCVDGADTDETDAPPPAPACSDGLDSDADGMIDFPADPGCVDGADTDETDAPPPPDSARVVMAAGDIACDPASSEFGRTDPNVCQHLATRDLLNGADAILPLGDLQNADGTLDQFIHGYDPSWGQYASNTYPAVGNHEYNVPGAQGYFDYWASKGRPTGDLASGYYSFDLGSWHLISLNSNCSTVPCDETFPQNDFLERDLANTSQPCIAAFWHHPYFNSGAVHGQSAPSGAKAFWDDLFAAGADIVLNGHEHNYQRYAKQDPARQPAPNGIREFGAGWPAGS